MSNISRLFPSSSESETVKSSPSPNKKGLRRRAKKRSLILNPKPEVFSSSSEAESELEISAPKPIKLPEPTFFQVPPLVPFPSRSRSIDFVLEQLPVKSPRLDRRLSLRKDFLPPLGDTRTRPAPDSSEANMFAYDVVDYVFFYIHGIGGSEEGLAESLRKLGETLSFVKEQWFWPVNCEMELELINLKNAFSREQEEMFERIKPFKTSSERMTQARNKLNTTFADILYYMVPGRRGGIIKTVIAKMNEKLTAMRSNSPGKFRNSKIVLIGFSLGSVILHDLLMAQFEPGNCNSLSFQPYAVYMLGSPLSVFLSVRNDSDGPPRLELPKHIPRYYNIFDPNDPVAFRQEPIFYGDSLEECAPSVLLPVFENPSNEQRPEDAQVDPQAAAVQLNGMLAFSRRIDYALNVALAGENMSSLMPAVALAGPMMSAHSSYISSRDVGLFIWRTLTGFDPAKTIN